MTPPEAQARPAPVAAVLAVDPARGLALLEAEAGRVLFDGIALGPGVYVDAAGRRVRVRETHLPLVAKRVRGVFLRDLHREDLGASVGVVTAARLEGGEVRFTGDVRLAPYVELVRHFWEHIRFSLGFRYDEADLVRNEDGTYDLPLNFLVDHLALVPQGQYRNAKLVRLLNQARGLASLHEASSRSGEPSGEPMWSAGPVASDPERSPLAPSSPPGPARGQPSLSGGIPMVAETENVEQLRQQRDQALEAARTAQEAASAAEAATQAVRLDLDASRQAAKTAEAASEASRREMGQAKNRLAAEVMKAELAAGKDFDLDERKRELTGMDLAALDQLRGQLRLGAQAAGEGGAPKTLPGAPVEPAAAPAAKAEALDLQALSLNETLRLAFQQGAF